MDEEVDLCSYRAQTVFNMPAERGGETEGGREEGREEGGREGGGRERGT